MFRASYSGGKVANRTSPFWWLSGGIPAVNCIAAYQPKGATDYETSTINLANPNQYNLTPRSGSPVFDTSYGWYFNTNQNVQLVTGEIPDDNISVIIRYSDVVPNTNVNAGYIFGYFQFFRIYIRATINGAASVGYGTSNFSVGNNLTTGICALTKDAFYLDGLKITDINETFTSNVSYGIGGRSDTNYGQFFKMQAIALYNSVLTPYQVAALTTAMNAL